MGTLQWAPRLLAVAFSLFLGIFALDAFSGAVAFPRSLLDFAIHLIPSAVLLAVVAAAWRREWIGAAAFLILALAYAAVAGTHPSWIATIAGPMVVVAVLYAWSWTRRRTAVARR